MSPFSLFPTQWEWIRGTKINQVVTNSEVRYRHRARKSVATSAPMMSNYIIKRPPPTRTKMPHVVRCHDFPAHTCKVERNGPHFVRICTVPHLLYCHSYSTFLLLYSNIHFVHCSLSVPPILSVKGHSGPPTRVRTFSREINGAFTCCFSFCVICRNRLAFER